VPIKDVTIQGKHIVVFTDDTGFTRSYFRFNQLKNKWYNTNDADVIYDGIKNDTESINLS